MRRGLLASRDELRALGERVAERPFDAIHEALNLRCSLILESGPVTETQWQTLWQHGSWAAALTAARITQGRIFDLVIAHHIEPNNAFRDRAIEELNNLAGWSTWVDPCHNHVPADLCTAEAGVAAVVGLDWLWEDLDVADRQRVLNAIRDKLVVPYRKAVAQKAWWYTCYHNWNAVVNGGCGLAALALDDDEEARGAYRQARAGLKHFFAALGREGGWDEGIGHWGCAMRHVLLLAEATRRQLDDEKIFHARGMNVTGLFPVYFTPNGRAASFGNASAVPLYGTFYLLARQYKLPEVTWWLDTFAFRRDVSTSGWASAGLAMIFRPPGAEQGDQIDLAPVKVFQQIGWGAMADRWPRPAFYVAAKTGDLSASNSQRDMGALQLQVDGEMLLVDRGGGNGNHGSTGARDEFYDVQARAHNTITIAERDHQIDAQGTIAHSRAGRHYRWLACDAKDACGENVRFIRHLVMIVDPKTKLGQMLVVLDDVNSTTPEKVELFWHTDGQISLDRAEQVGTITGQQAAVHFALAASVPTDLVKRLQQSGPNTTDRILHVVGGAIDQTFLASVFSREPITTPLELAGGAGSPTVKVNNVTVRFRRLRRHLQLHSVDLS